MKRWLLATLAIVMAALALSAPPATAGTTLAAKRSQVLASSAHKPVPRPATTSKPDHTIVCLGYPKAPKNYPSTIWSTSDFECIPGPPDLSSAYVSIEVWNGSLHRWINYSRSEYNHPFKTRTISTPLDPTRPCRSSDPLHTFRTKARMDIFHGEWDHDTAYAPIQDPKRWPNGHGIQMHCAIPPLN